MTGPLVPTLRAAGLAAALLLSQSARASAAAPPASYDWWEDAPERPMGDHDGLTDRLRAWRAGRGPAT